MDFERKFIMEGLIGAIGSMPDYKVRLTAANWRDKGVLLEEDLVEIQTRLDAKNGVVRENEKEMGEAADDEA